MIPVEVTQTPWHYTNFWDWLDHWQTLIAGFLAFAAGVGTVVVAMRVIAATREQTATTVRLEQTRNANEVSAFRVMLEAAMTRVLDEAAWARKTHPLILAQKAPSVSDEALAVRQSITKGAFAELRAACVGQGGPLTGEFLDLEREIDSFAAQNRSQAGLVEQLTLIETKAAELRQKAVERI